MYIAFLNDDIAFIEYAKKSKNKEIRNILLNEDISEIQNWKFHSSTQNKMLLQIEEYREKKLLEREKKLLEDEIIIEEAIEYMEKFRPFFRLSDNDI